MTESANNFWKDRRVFITGHTGFKGSWLTLWLTELGAKISAYALDPQPTQTLFDELGISKRIIDARGNISNSSALRTAITDFCPEVVIHMAAQSLVRPSYESPVDTINTNLLGTVNLLESIREIDSVRCALVVTSDKAYQNMDKGLPFTETDPLGGNDPYSASKACAEIVTASYRNSFLRPDGSRPVGLATARAGNVIGGGDWARDRLIPDAIRAFQDHEVLQVRAPHATRPWQHVLEPLSGYILLCEKLFQNPDLYAGAWNFGPRLEGIVPVKEIIDRLVLLYGSNASWNYADSPKPVHESSFLSLDITKAKNDLDWSPRWDLDTTLKATVEWYLAHDHGEDLQTLTINQISDYCAVSDA